MVLASGPPDSDESDEYHLWSIGGDDGRDDAKAVGKVMRLFRTCRVVGCLAAGIHNALTSPRRASLDLSSEILISTGSYTVF
jgi:hypothetical protein